MSKQKAKTIQQRFGFMDTDLKKSTHDEIMFWLDSSIEERLPSWVGYESEWNPQVISDCQSNFSIKRSELLTAIDTRLANIEDRIAKCDKSEKDKENAPGVSSLWLKRAQEERQKLECQQIKLRKLHSDVLQLDSLGPVPKKPPLLNLRKTWEYPVATNNSYGNKYVVGFVDMRIVYDTPILTVEGLAINGNDIVERFQDRDDADIIWAPRWHVRTADKYDHDRPIPLHFEVKTEIPNVGELVRQINMYREYGVGKIIVVSPDDRYAKLLSEQGIGFQKYEGSNPD